MTIGDQLEIKTLPVYKCQIKDLDGRFMSFHAIGLPRITGEMFCPLTRVQLKELFPKTKDIKSLAVRDPVDFLIGLNKAGILPVRGVKAR